MKKEHLLSDPYFSLLPEFERLQVLYAVDPSYRRLSPSQRWAVVHSVPSIPPIAYNDNTEFDPMVPVPPPGSE